MLSLTKIKYSSEGIKETARRELVLACVRCTLRWMSQAGREPNAKNDAAGHRKETN